MSKATGELEDRLGGRETNHHALQPPQFIPLFHCHSKVGDAVQAADRHER